MVARKMVVLMYFLVAFSALAALSVLWLPEFGYYPEREVSLFYLDNALELTGSANAVNAIVWDFRGYDTLGEETVLFTAALGVFLVLRKKLPHREPSEAEEEF